jgi:hypothetical protein
MERKMEMVVRRRIVPLVLLGVFILLLAACSQGGEATPAVTAIVTEMTSPLPTATQPPVASPTAEAVPTVAQDLTPQPDLGLVLGVLYVDDQPKAGETLYLAPLLPGGDDMRVAGLDPTKDPRASTGASGDFTFLNVPEGEYALGIVGPVGLVLIRGTDGREITIEVQAGQITDMGTIHVPSFE